MATANELADKLHEHIAALWKIRDAIRLLPPTESNYEMDLAERRVGSAARKLTKAAHELRLVR